MCSSSSNVLRPRYAAVFAKVSTRFICELDCDHDFTMNNKSPIYNSRIILFFLEYVGSRYPDLDVDAVLDYAGLTKYEVNDPACWVNQEQTDRFHEALVEKTANPNIALDAGRYAGSSRASGAVKHYILGLLDPGSVYLMMGRFYAYLSRGADVKTKRKGSKSVEIITTPKPGVNEKYYQCEGTADSIYEIISAIEDLDPNAEDNSEMVASIVNDISWEM